MEVSAPTGNPISNAGEAAQAAHDGAAETSEELWEPAEEDWNKKIRHKVNGKEMTLTLKQLRDGYGLEQTARQRMEEAATHRKWREQFEPELQTHRQSQKQIQQMFELVKGDPEAYFELGRSLGLDVDTLMFNKTMEEVRYRTADEAERKAIDRERDFARQQKELAKLQKQTQTYEQQKYTDSWKQRLMRDESQLLQKHPDFASDREWRDETLEMMVRSREGNRQSLSLSEAADLVRQKFERIAGRKAEAMLQERIKSGNIPEELRQSVRTRESEAIKDRKQANFGGNRAPSSKSKTMSPEEYFDNLKQQR